MTGHADYLALGDYNAVCYECGRKFKASELKRHWQGYYVCPKHWEPRHPQDFVRAVPDVQTPPWTQPMPEDQYVTDFSGVLVTEFYDPLNPFPFELTTEAGDILTTETY